jgi:hypothetical protein
MDRQSQQSISTPYRTDKNIYFLFPAAFSIIALIMTRLEKVYTIMWYSKFPTILSAVY